jgi:AcrR family transcriptional regulator
VATSQRTRLVRAAAELGAERGFSSLTLADIVERAGVARTTFYEYFANKEECYLGALDYAADRVLGKVLDGPYPDDADPASASMHRFVELCVEEPGLARLVASDAEALGPEAAERQRAVTLRMADGVVAMRERLRREHPRLAPITRLRALATFGALTELLRHSIHTSGFDALPELEAELTTVVVALLEAPQP